MRSPLLLVALPAFVSFRAACGDVVLPPLVSDNMLLQKSRAVVWGKADPGEKVSVKLGEAAAKATAKDDGTWRVVLEGLKTGIAGDLTVAGKNQLVVHNVAVGDVWVCSGQSNMEFVMSRTNNAQQEIAAANAPEIRMFTVLKKTSQKPESEVQGKWEVCASGAISKWSAAGYFFARKIHADLAVPVGMIHSSVGGTPAQSWTPAETLEADPDLKTYQTKWLPVVAKYPEAKALYDSKTLPEWQAAADQAKAAGAKAPPKPPQPQGPDSGKAPSSLYNGMINGLTRYGIKGVIWYQGESNVSDEARYKKLFPAMIGSWRNAWTANDAVANAERPFPFIFTQIASFGPPRDVPFDSHRAALRDVQRLSLSVPNTAMAVTLDIGDPNNIHPTDKQDVGLRLALAAEAKVYGKEIVSSGPLFANAKFEGGEARIAFEPGTAFGLMSKDGGPLKGFAVAGEDRKFVWGEAKIVHGKKSKEGSGGAEEPMIAVSSPAVPKPAAVRYGWADSPDVNLVNKAGLPASSFRSDDWPLMPPPPLKKMDSSAEPSASGAEASGAIPSEPAKASVSPVPQASPASTQPGKRP